MQFGTLSQRLNDLAAPAKAGKSAPQHIPRVASQPVGKFFERPRIRNPVEPREREQSARRVGGRTAQPRAHRNILADRHVRPRRMKAGDEPFPRLKGVVLFGRDIFAALAAHIHVDEPVAPSFGNDSIVKIDRTNERIEKMIPALFARNVEREVEFRICSNLRRIHLVHCSTFWKGKQTENRGGCSAPVSLSKNLHGHAYRREG